MKSKRCVRCDYYATAHGRDDFARLVCAEFVEPAPLWLRIRTKIVGWLL